MHEKMRLLNSKKKCNDFNKGEKLYNVFSKASQISIHSIKKTSTFLFRHKVAYTCDVTQRHLKNMATSGKKSALFVCLGKFAFGVKPGVKKHLMYV